MKFGCKAERFYLLMILDHTLQNCEEKKFQDQRRGQVDLIDLLQIPRNTTQKYDFHCWWRTCLGPFLAKTSRTAVLTAIMDLSAGGRLYKCLYKMHVASRAFWGAFWGAFRVFLIDVG